MHKRQHDDRILRDDSDYERQFGGISDSEYKKLYDLYGFAVNEVPGLAQAAVQRLRQIN